VYLTGILLRAGLAAPVQERVIYPTSVFTIYTAGIAKKVRARGKLLKDLLLSQWGPPRFARGDRVGGARPAEVGTATLRSR